MKLAAIPVSGATADALAGASGTGTEAMGLTCEEVNSGGTLVPMEKKCYNLVFDQSSSQSLYTIDASKAGSIAFFAEHLPTEFEDTEHYLKDTTKADIEPVAQEPEPGEGGHAHAHGGAEAWKSLCVCHAREKGWKLDCTNKAAIEGSVSKLAANEKCKATAPPKECLPDQLPTGIEKTLHDYEHFYDDCFVKRQFDADLGKCPAVDCSDSEAMIKAVTILQAGCITSAACADKTCADAIKVVLAAHDLCDEKKLPNNLEDALHDHEDPCEAQLCNTADAAFDPYADLCGVTDGDKKGSTTAKPNAIEGNASAAAGLGSQKGFLVTMLALPLAALLLSRP